MKKVHPDQLDLFQTIEEDDVEELHYTDYSPGHPWWYKLGGPILNVEDIEPAKDVTVDWFLKRAGSDPKKVRKILDMEFKKGIESLRQDEVRYLSLRERGLDALDEVDRRMNKGNEMMAYYVAISLKHNHISYNKGRIAEISSHLEKIE